MISLFGLQKQNYFHFFRNFRRSAAVNALVIISKDMQTTQFNMMQNAVEMAKYKLAQHRVQGEGSGLSVFQVAQLMDTVRNGESAVANKHNSVFFSMN